MKIQHLDSRAIAAILRFCFADADRFRGRDAEELPDELLIKVRSFAAGKLKRKEVEEFCGALGTNNLAIETLASEIKQHWG
jgi:hypothetical protein